jgi:hypothetical protein
MIRLATFEGRSARFHNSVTDQAFMVLPLRWFLPR